MIRLEWIDRNRLISWLQNLVHHIPKTWKIKLNFLYRKLTFGLLEPHLLETQNRCSHLYLHQRSASMMSWIVLSAAAADNAGGKKKIMGPLYYCYKREFTSINLLHNFFTPCPVFHCKAGLSLRGDLCKLYVFFISPVPLSIVYVKLQWILFIADSQKNLGGENVSYLFIKI